MASTCEDDSVFRVRRIRVHEYVSPASPMITEYRVWTAVEGAKELNRPE